MHHEILFNKCKRKKKKLSDTFTVVFFRYFEHDPFLTYKMSQVSKFP